MLSDLFENISYKFHDKKVKFEVFSDKFKEDIYLLKNIFKKVNLNIEEVPKKNWVNESQKKYAFYKTDLFCFYQGIGDTPSTKKKIIIPAGLSFGTGGHESTILVVKLFEKLIKREKFNISLDIGTGTGILSFVLASKLKKKVLLQTF